MKVLCADFVRDTKKEIALAKKDQRRTATILPTKKRGRLLMLEKLDSLVQPYISAASNTCSFITKSAVTSTA